MCYTCRFNNIGDSNNKVCYIFLYMNYYNQILLELKTNDSFDIQIACVCNLNIFYSIYSGYHIQILQFILLLLASIDLSPMHIGPDKLAGLAEGDVEYTFVMTNILLVSLKGGGTCQNSKIFFLHKCYL